MSTTLPSFTPMTRRDGQAPGPDTATTDRPPEATSEAPNEATSETPNASRLIAITPLARLAAEPWRLSALRGREHPTLFVLTRGQGRVTLGGGTRGYGPHHVVYVPTGVIHGLEPLGAVAGVRLDLPVGADFPWPAAAHHLRLVGRIEQTELTGLVDRIAAEAAGHAPGRAQALKSLTGLLAVWLLRHAPAAEPAAPAPEAAGPALGRLAARYAELVERDFTRAKSVADFAADLGVTPTHLSRACRAANGKPASDLLAARRAAEARQLLAETDLPVKDVARRLGYSTPAYFTRAFRAETGHAPTQFRALACRRQAG